MKTLALHGDSKALTYRNEEYMAATASRAAASALYLGSKPKVFRAPRCAHAVRARCGRV
jgi:hypothetical protein